jgi:SAM-dependent methyltransferase
VSAIAPNTASAGRIVAGAEYAQAILARASDRRARSAFQTLVLTLAKPGAALFDFGAGTGIDARCYAERGFSVGAYDIDAQMCDYFAAYCRELILARRISLMRGSYREFMQDPIVDLRGRIDLVTANFAPLNLIEDLTELFAKFHALTVPLGAVLASVLSPYFIGDAKYDWWWRNLGALWRRGHYAVQGAQAPIVRRRLGDFAAQSLPYFTLERVFRGTIGRAPPRGGSVGRRPLAWLPVTTCRFMFLLFRRAP